MQLGGRSCVYFVLTVLRQEVVSDCKETLIYMYVVKIVRRN